jgi:molecular chaperone GrpE
MEIRIRENDRNLLPPADLEAEIKRLQDELLQERDRNLRTLADFKNYRRRIERDGNKIAEEGKRGMLLPLLEIIDDMEKALQSANDAEQPFIQGMRIIRQKFLTLLEMYGVIPFKSAGTPFNHDRHQAIDMTEHRDMKPGTVVSELRRGYLLNNELLRPAQVRVAGERTEANKISIEAR